MMALLLQIVETACLILLAIEPTKKLLQSWKNRVARSRDAKLHEEMQHIEQAMASERAQEHSK